jgi:BirA family biotin operon repressor/biotin-[acetyl-CoA-carboxylase] ligase
VDSTNDGVRRLAFRNAEEGTVVAADQQTTGRGRLGRPWHSPAGMGLYISVLICPEDPPARVTRWTLAASVAACEACREIAGCAVGIDWPNDLVFGSRKLGGILAELRSPSGRRSELVIGAGLNVSQRPQDLPENLAPRATSLRLASGRSILDRERLAAAYLRRLAWAWDRLRDDAWDEVAQRWESLACGAHGNRVRVLADEATGDRGAYEGVTMGLDTTGALLVRRSDGTIVAVRMAEAVVPLEG